MLASWEESRFKLAFLVMVGTVAVVIAQTDWGTYTCTACSPANPWDDMTRSFIKSTVNQDVPAWKAGDHATIINSNTGEAGVWGRANNLTTDYNLFEVVSYGDESDCDDDPDSDVSLCGN